MCVLKLNKIFSREHTECTCHWPTSGSKRAILLTKIYSICSLFRKSFRITNSDSNLRKALAVFLTCVETTQKKI